MSQQLSAQDAQFLYIQNGNTLTHVMGINICDPSTAPGGQVRFKDIVAHIASRIDTSPVFKRKLFRLPFDLDHPYWVEDTNFELEAHVTHARLPEPGDWRQFCIQVARHFSRQMDMSRPLWDIYVLEGLDRIPGIAPGSYAMLTRIHHAAIDGASAAHMFVAISDSDAIGTPAIPLGPASFKLGEKPTPAQILAQAIQSNMTSPIKFMNTLLKMSPALAAAANKSMREQKGARSGVPDTRFNAPISTHRMFDATEFSLADLGLIRKLVDGATVNDVVLAICSGALRAYLLHHGELPAETLVAVAPINLRSAKGEADVPGNNISAMSVELATHLADPAARLAAIRRYTVDAKAAKTGISARIMTDLTKHIPGATMAGVARIITSPRFAPRQTNVFISNVPGPQQPLYINGATITHQYGLAPLANNMGLFIATPSYNGRMSFCITSERSIMPDVAFFRECIEASFRELLAAQPLPTDQPLPPEKSRPIKKAVPVDATASAIRKKAAIKPRKAVAKSGKTGQSRAPKGRKG
jgi:diacylglycerol O-acyltransferase / wax synthase